jgi:putative aldouronate transport system substrate-binding protein
LNWLTYYRTEVQVEYSDNDANPTVLDTYDEQYRELYKIYSVGLKLSCAMYLAENLKEWSQFGEQYENLADIYEHMIKFAPEILQMVETACKQFPDKFFDENPEMRRGATHSDGKIYFIPFAMDGKAATGWYIRKDWLKKLNLEEPKTVDELYTVLKAFKEQDPNGNGKADEIPFFQRGKVVTDLYPLFGVRLNWHVNKEGKVVYGQYTPEFKTAVENVAKWYKEGLIDQEIFTRSQNARDYALQENIGGCTHDWFTSTAAFNDLLAPKIEGFEFAPIIPPADVNGVSWEPGSRDLTATSGWGISVQCKNPEAMIKYMDFWFTEVGSNLANFGIEGEEWTMVDNKQMFTEKMFQGDQSVVQKLWKIGAQVPSGMGYKQNYWYEEQTLSPRVQEAIRTYIDGGYIIEPFPSIVLTEDEKKIVDKYLPAIQTYIRETEQQWIMGSKDVTTTFDDYMKSLKNMGMDEVVKVYNDAYQRYMSK